MQKKNPLLASFVAVGIVSTLAGCASSPTSARNPARTEPTPLTREQAEQLHEIGTRLFTLNLVENRIRREAEIDQRMKALLRQTLRDLQPDDQNRSLEILKLSLSGATSLMSAETSIGGSASGAASASTNGRSVAPPSEIVSYGTIAYIIVGWAVIESFEPTSSVGGKGGRLHRERAAEEHARVRQAFERAVDETVATYSEIFGLNAARRVTFRKKYRDSLLAEARKNPDAQQVRGEPVIVLLKHGLVSRAQSEDFEATAKLLAASRSAATIDARTFVDDVALGRRYLQAYVDWLADLKPGLTDADLIARIDGEIERTRRLLARI